MTTDFKGFDSPEDAAAYFVMEEWQAAEYKSTAPTYAIWSGQNDEGSQAVVVLGMHSQSPQLAVLCRKEKQGWLAFGWAHRWGLLSCSCEEHSGPHLYSWMHPGTAESAEISFADKLTAELIIEKHLFFVDWSGKTRSQLSRFSEGEFSIKIDGKLVWDASTQAEFLWSILADSAEFAAAHKRYFYSGFASDADYWADEILHDSTIREEKLAACLALIYSEPPKNFNEKYLGFIGAGPLEDLMSDWLLAQLPERIDDERLAYALLSVRMEFEKAELQSGLKRKLKSFLERQELKNRKADKGGLRAERIGKPRELL
ncbi:MAG: hypothetical protein K2X27_13190 [Candidatus Obscuribacterales bacterium]|nr:hypothetical protein [Candidatus Obscuribacterales bacterium]